MFFTRGEGTDHAKRDVAIARRAIEEDREVEVIFASWSEGWRYLRGVGWPCRNIGPKLGDEHERLIGIGRAMDEEKPDLVVTDEELMALPMAKVFHIPSVLITNWFPPNKRHPLMGYFVDPELILVPAPKDVYAKPEELDLLTPVKFVGPIAFLTERHKMKRILRQRLRVAMDERLILVDPCGVEMDDDRFLRCCCEAFEDLGLLVRMVMVVGKLRAEIEKFTWKDTRIHLRDHLWMPEVYMAGSDLVVHRGGFFTVWNLAGMGVPSIYVPRLKGEFRAQILQMAQNLHDRNVTILVKERELSRRTLAPAMREILFDPDRWDEISSAAVNLCLVDGATGAALEILKKLKGKEVKGDGGEHERGAVDRAEHGGA